MALATTLMAQHGFSEALGLARRAHISSPENIQALALAGDCHLELGNYEQAEATFDDLLRKNSSSAALARRARLLEIKGNSDQAIKILLRARHKLLRTANGNQLSWYDMRLGEIYFNTGDLQQAARHFQRAVAAVPNNAHAQAGLARTKAAQGDFSEAITLYEKAAATHPDLQILDDLAATYNAVDNNTAAIQTHQKALELIDRHQLDHAHSRQIARYYADNDIRLPQALKIARDELKKRKDIYTYDTFAWVLYKNRRYNEAAETIKIALQFDTDDPHLHFHAGMIASVTKDRPTATHHLNRALGLNPHFHPRHAQTCRQTLDTVKQR